MSRKKNDDKIRGHFFPMFYETRRSPAWKQLSFGARELFTALRMRCFKNNGHVYLSQRDAGEDLGHANRNDIANWYRELQHYGFIVQTEAASLGVDGKGKAPHWRITDLPARGGGGDLLTAPRTSCAGTGRYSSHTLPLPDAGMRARRRPSKNRTPGCTSVPQWTARRYQRWTARRYHLTTEVVQTCSPYRSMWVVRTCSPYLG